MMHAHFEDRVTTRSDCSIQCLSWMGKVPDGLPEEEGWKLNRVNYYQEGWLATGNTSGIVGVTFTAAHCKKTIDGPPRSNFNLRGHRSEVILVKWNEPYQKLATCDATGVIFVWIKHEGRWSIELINDRSSQVTDFTWSHDGRMALICYRDGFVLVGSVAGQRYWSSMLNLENCLITSGCWSQDDQKVLFGTTDGQIVVMNASGAMLTRVTVQDTVEIVAMSWACEKFYLSESDRSPPASTRPDSSPVLTVSFRTGAIYLMSNYDDVCPKVIHTGLTGIRMEWSNDGEVLAVAGFVRLPNLECRNELRFYNRQGALRYRLPVPQQSKPVSHLTWGHNDRRLYIAVGCHLYTICVTKKVATLQLLCRRRVQTCIHDEMSIQKLPLPVKIQSSIQAMFMPTVRGYIPEAHKIREFVCIPPTPPERLHCTMIRHGEECSGGHYTLYLEYLGGLIPLLKGKRASKLRPEFIIFDPKIKAAYNHKTDDDVFVSSDSSLSDEDSEADAVVEGCGSPRPQRRKKTRKLKDHFERRDSVGVACNRPIDELMYDDNLPEAHKLVEVTSNLWGTKFKLHSLASFLPEDLGQVLYKTSLLHLQPRQMTITIVEISPELKTEARDPGYNANHFSESEDDSVLNGEGAPDGASSAGYHGYQENLIAISPEAPSCPHPIPALATPKKRPDPPCGLTEDPVPARVPSDPSCGLTEDTHAAPARAPQQPSIFLNHMDLLDPLEIRSLEGSPPQRRSPSFKPRSLSPAEQMPPSINNSLINGTTQGLDPFALNVDVFRHKDSQSATRAGSRTIQLTSKDIKRENRTEIPPSSLNIVRQAAKKLETCVDNGEEIASRKLGSLTKNCDQFDSKRLEAGVSNGDAGPVSQSESSGSSSGSDLTQLHQTLSRWADKACHELKYIDDDIDEKDTPDSKEAVFCNMTELSAREIMSSMQMLHQLEQSQDSCHLITGAGDLGSSGTTSIIAQIQSIPIFEPQKKRVILSRPSESKPRSKLKDLKLASLRNNTRCLDLSRGDRCTPQNGTLGTCRSQSTSPTASRRTLQASHAVPSPNEARRGSLDLCRNLSTMGNTEIMANQSTSLPSSPVKVLQKGSKKAKGKGNHRHKLQNPLSNRKQRHSRAVDSSDDEVALSGDDVTTSENYRNLETFQKAQLSRKLRKARTKSDIDTDRRSPHQSPGPSPHGSPGASHKRHFVMHNKAPMWNENSQVYQLDFGGRVTQESAKNFQIEFRGKQVMQFGRIDSNAYTLDFQYPFSAIQAFAVALANVTQRLK